VLKKRTQVEPVRGVKLRVLKAINAASRPVSRLASRAAFRAIALFPMHSALENLIQSIPGIDAAGASPGQSFQPERDFPPSLVHPHRLPLP